MLHWMPQQLLQLWTANECSIRVAGDPDIEVADLKKQTRFRRVAGGVAASGRAREVELMFWECVERMSMSERSLLLKFAAVRYPAAPPCRPMSNRLLPVRRAACACHARWR